MLKLNYSPDIAQDEFFLPIWLTHNPSDSDDVSASDATVLAGFSEEIPDEKRSLCGNQIGREFLPEKIKINIPHTFSRTTTQ